MDDRDSTRPGRSEFTTSDGSGVFWAWGGEENRLVSVTRCSDWQVLQELAYDGVGRRVQTVEYVDPATGAQLPAEKVTRHVYRGIETIEEYDVGADGQGGTTSTLAREFVWGRRFPEPVGMIDRTGAGAQPGGTPEVLHYLRDVLGSVVALTDAGGQVVERYAYDAYGKTYTTNAGGTVLAASAFGNPFGFTGQRYDAGVRLYHFWYRTYSPTQGRWMQRDPMGYVDGVSLYEYVLSFPLGSLDAFGLQAASQPGDDCPPVDRKGKDVDSGQNYEEISDRQRQTRREYKRQVREEAGDQPVKHSDKGKNHNKNVRIDNVDKSAQDGANDANQRRGVVNWAAAKDAAAALGAGLTQVGSAAQSAVADILIGLTDFSGMIRAHFDPWGQWRGPRPGGGAAVNSMSLEQGSQDPGRLPLAGRDGR